MRLQDFMSRNIKSVGVRESIEAAYEKMRLNGIHHLVVLEGKRVVGILSERDIKNRSSRERQNLFIEDLMQTDVVTAKPDTTIKQAANLMRGRVIGCLPVVKDNKIVGIITITDLLTLLGQGIERIHEDTPKRVVKRNPKSKNSS